MTLPVVREERMTRCPIQEPNQSMQRSDLKSRMNSSADRAHADRIVRPSSPVESTAAEHDSPPYRIASQR
jgi:hypothetical protein